jgi:Raf kinase inhibitor-like YbhB/YbcL family protein
MLAALLVAALAGCSSGSPPAAERDLPDELRVSSPALAEGATVPTRFTCAGADVSPPLAWSGTPPGTDELAVIVDDPDAPGGTFVHWVLFGLDPDLTALAEGKLPAGARQAPNSAGGGGYKGPCPPPGPAHRYRFTVYALGQRLSLAGGAGTSAAVEAIERAAIARGRLSATFAR